MENVRKFVLELLSVLSGNRLIGKTKKLVIMANVAISFILITYISQPLAFKNKYLGILL